MSSLYIRLRTSFFTHRKTIRLRALIGDDAYWVPPRLWAYAADNQPDGDMSSFSSEELAMLIGCPKHATSIRQALLQAGFLDEDGGIHNWQEHNGYHAAYKVRAKAAAAARWSKKNTPPPKAPPQTPPKDKDKDRDKETSIASSMLEASPWLVEYGLEMPETLRTPECMEAVKAWLRYKAEKRSSYKPSGLEVALRKWAKDYSPAQFCMAVERSMANGWSGLFEAKDTHGTGPGNRNGAQTPHRNDHIAGDHAESQRLRTERKQFMEDNFSEMVGLQLTDSEKSGYGSGVAGEAVPNPQNQPF